MRYISLHFACQDEPNVRAWLEDLAVSTGQDQRRIPSAEDTRLWCWVSSSFFDRSLGEHRPFRGTAPPSTRCLSVDVTGPNWGEAEVESLWRGFLEAVPHGCVMAGSGKGVRESAGINRLGIGNERVLQGRPSQSPWPRTVRSRW